MFGVEVDRGGERSGLAHLTTSLRRGGSRRPSGSAQGGSPGVEICGGGLLSRDVVCVYCSSFRADLPHFDHRRVAGAADCDALGVQRDESGGRLPHCVVDGHRVLGWHALVSWGTHPSIMRGSEETGPRGRGGRL